MTASIEIAHQPRVEDAVGRSLAAYKRYETHDLDIAEVEIRRFMAPGRLRACPGDRDGVDARAFYADTGSVGVGRMSYGAEVTVDRPAGSRYLGVAIPLSGHLRLWRGREAVDARAGKSLVVIAPQGRIVTEWSADCDALMLRVTTSALARAARVLTGAHEPDSPPRFVHQVLTLEQGHAVYSAARLLAEVFGRYDDVTAVPNGVLHQLSEHALSAVLLGLEHDLSRPTRPPYRAAPSDVVRSAMRMVEDETAAEFNVNELARRLGVTARALQLGFRRALDRTPREYIRQIRLERAHRELLAADATDGTTVTEIATRWGFFHTGRFATAYRAVYGVTPSVSLKGGTEEERPPRVV
ncbi:AraC family transcriptional regulator [Amycolatopsis endophytica]|uniref:AraC-like DNA-binding protein n=1 Tax=Amycolatopsis endophytica TaxID=860233 RepID=A0A853B8G3_9PSEU|nr:AraC family transcriptional regulator [Amycolatopsis endophytica]NYI91603.1 AraC-like DNA-binding protein [Amycolatopsis endophytica]